MPRLSIANITDAQRDAAFAEIRALELEWHLFKGQPGEMPIDEWRRRAGEIAARCGHEQGYGPVWQMYCQTYGLDSHTGDPDDDQKGAV